MYEATDREYNVNRLASFFCSYSIIPPFQEEISYLSIAGERTWTETAKATTNDFVPFRPLRKAEVSLIETNKAIMSTFLMLHLRNDLMNSLAIFEDDCYFKIEKDQYEELLRSVPKDWDVLVLGGSFKEGFCKSVASKNGWDLVSHPATNTTSSIIYNKKCLPAILSLMNKYSLPLDWHLNYVFKTLDLKVWHANPYIAGQNLFESSIQNAE
jgi:hypothetical protein